MTASAVGNSTIERPPLRVSASEISRSSSPSTPAVYMPLCWMQAVRILAVLETRWTSCSASVVEGEGSGDLSYGHESARCAHWPEWRTGACAWVGNTLKWMRIMRLWREGRAGLISRHTQLRCRKLHFSHLSSTHAVPRLVLALRVKQCSTCALRTASTCCGSML
jgi:hypothetical protein